MGAENGDVGIWADSQDLKLLGWIAEIVIWSEGGIRGSGLRNGFGYLV